MNAELVVKGARKITLTLVPTAEPLDIGHRRGAYNEEVNLNLAGLTMRYSGVSKPINFLKILKVALAYDPLDPLVAGGFSESAAAQIRGEGPSNYQNRKDIISALNKLGLGGATGALYNFDIHSIIVDTLRNYIQKATGNPNAIVLLPNINVICRDHIDQLRKDARAAKYDEDKEPESRFLYNPLLGALGFEENFIKNLLESFGLELHVVLRDSINKSVDIKVIPTTSVARKLDYENSKTADERFQEKYTVHDFYAKLRRASNKGIPNHKFAVNNIIDKINKNAGDNYTIQRTSISETDIKILDIWGGSPKAISAHKFPTFGGYRDFTERKEAVIFGDIALIKKYLYGSVDLNVKFKNIQEYQDAASKAFENHDKYQKQLQTISHPPSHALTDDQAASATLETSALEVAVAEQAEIYKLGIVGMLNAVPLHPLDAIILTNSAYNKKIREIAFPKITGAGSFGDISYLPDNFGYSDKQFTDDEEDYIKKQGIPIFRYNTENPNVLDLKFKFSNIYYAALKAGFAKVASRKASAVVEGILPLGRGSFPIRTRGAAVAYLKLRNFSTNTDDQAEILNSLTKQLSPELIESLQSDDDPKDGADAIAAILTNFETGKDADLKGIIEIEQALPGNPQSIMTDLSERMFRTAHSINITTLPLFHISNMHNLRSPCVVLAQDAGIRQSNQPKRDAMNTFFSGLYAIMGFKHSISMGKATSEFSLIKNAPNYKAQDAKKKKEQDALDQSEGEIGQ
tara:strand:- start:593 stop:2830 length:2238 start_codon:yes stop_codon:yes gene_type:complete